MGGTGSSAFNFNSMSGMPNNNNSSGQGLFGAASNNNTTGGGEGLFAFGSGNNNGLNVPKKIDEPSSSGASNANNTNGNANEENKPEAAAQVIYLSKGDIETKYSSTLVAL